MSTPRRAAAALLAALSVLMAAPAAHATPQPFGGNERYADGEWLVRTGKTYWLYVAAGDAYTWADPQGATAFENETEGVIARFKCKVFRFHGWKGIACSGRARFQHVDPQNLIIDPTLNIAKLTMQSGTFTNTVSWAAEDAPDVGPIIDRGIDGAAAGAFVYQPATAQGTIFGHTIAPDYGEMFEVVVAGALEPKPDTRDDYFQVTRDGIRIHRTFRIQD